MNQSLFECQYDVEDDNSTFHIKDYVFATSAPVEGGHFWKTIKAPMQVRIANFVCIPVTYIKGMDLTCKMTDHKWK